MTKFAGGYILLEVLVAVAAVLFTLWGRKKRLQNKAHRPPRGFIKTAEVFIDPTTGIQQEVWFNPATGERYYHSTGRRGMGNE